MNRISIAKEEDRLAVAAILVKNKYTVRQGKSSKPGSKSYDYFLEYEPNEPSPAKKDGVSDEG